MPDTTPPLPPRDAQPGTGPDNRLFTVRPEPGAGYLVETDPRFTDRRTWLDSSYMLSALSVDAATIHKRLGDGFYEQQRVREQVAQLTGRRFLDGYANNKTISYYFRKVFSIGDPNAFSALKARLVAA